MSACYPCFAPIALHLCFAYAYRSTSPLPYCPSQYLVASKRTADGNRRTTPLLASDSVMSARRGSVGRPCEPLGWAKRNEQWSQASKICRTVLILGANKKKFHMDDRDGKVFCERFLLGNSEKISN